MHRVTLITKFQSMEDIAGTLAALPVCDDPAVGNPVKVAADVAVAVVAVRPSHCCRLLPLKP